MSFKKTQEHSKANVEIEGINVPEDNVIASLIKKYSDKLGPDVVKSLLYLINKSLNEEEKKENENSNRTSIRK